MYTDAKDPYLHFFDLCHSGPILNMHGKFTYHTHNKQRRKII